MDPITYIILLLVTAAAGGAFGGAALARRKREKRRNMREAIRSQVHVAGDAEVSIFDVFWDLGVSDFALEIMGKQRLLPADLQELPMAHDALTEAVEVHGDYGTFIRENLEAIQEFYEEHRKAGNRRNVPALEYKPYKTLPLPAVDGDSGRVPDAVKGSGNLPVKYTGGHLPIVAREFEDRVSTRTRSGGDLTPLQNQTSGYEVDVDQLTSVDPVEMLKGLFSGGLGSQLQRWWEMRNLRGLRDDLNTELSRLYQFYANQAHGNPNFYDHLYDTARRWKLEAERIEELAQNRPWKSKDWELCADCLVAEATAVARQLAWLSRNNIDQTLELIHERARRGDTAMAGYLVYLNHHAFFAGRGASYDRHVRRIDTVSHRMQQELRELMSRGVV